MNMGEILDKSRDTHWPLTMRFVPLTVTNGEDDRLLGLDRANPGESTLRREKSDKAKVRECMMHMDGLPFGPGNQTEANPHPLVFSSKGIICDTETTGEPQAHTRASFY